MTNSKKQNQVNAFIPLLNELEHHKKIMFDILLSNFDKQTENKTQRIICSTFLTIYNAQIQSNIDLIRKIISIDSKEEKENEKNAN